FTDFGGRKANRAGSVGSSLATQPTEPGGTKKPDQPAKVQIGLQCNSGDIMHQLRPYQQTALDKLRYGIRLNRMVQMLMLPTGAGKTTIASAMKQGAQEKGKRAFFIVDSLELVDQAVNRFLADGLDVGVIQGQNEMTDYSKP